MKALVYTGPKKIVFKNVPEPELSGDEVIVQVNSVGICGSDMHAYLGHDERRPAPLILGHEASGVILGGAQAGTKVVVNPLVTCGSCFDCLSGQSNLCFNREIISIAPRQGAFAEKISVPSRNLINVPDGLEFNKAALAEPLATSWHAVVLSGKFSARPICESNALVFGAGAVGLGAALVLKHFGCSRVIIAETNPLRRATARASGFEEVFDPNEMDLLTCGSINIIIDAVGNKFTRSESFRSIRPGGTIIHIGLGEGVDGLDARRLTLQEISLVGSYTYTMADFNAVVLAMVRGSLGKLDWIEVRPLKEGDKAFRELLSGQAAAAKIILTN